MEKRIPHERLRMIRDLFVHNEYAFTDGPPVPVLDVVLRHLYWTNDLRQIRPNDRLIEKLSRWRIPYRVRKRRYSAGTPVIFGPFEGDGAIINAPGTGSLPTRLPRNYAVFLKGSNLDVSDLSAVPLDLAAGGPTDESDVVELALHELVERWSFTNLSGIRDDFVPVFDELEGDGSEEVFLIPTPPASIGDVDLGTFTEDVTAYVAFPRPGVILFPNWFVVDGDDEPPWKDVGDVHMVDCALRIGGGMGGIRASVVPGGGAAVVSLPSFIGPFLGGADVSVQLPSPVIDLPFVTMIATVEGLRWNPAEGLGTMELEFAEFGGLPGLIASLQLHVDDARVTLIDGPDLQFEWATAAVALVAEVRDGRLFWDVKAGVKLRLSTEALDLEPGVLRRATSDIAHGLERTIEDVLGGNRAEQMGAFLFAIPLLAEEPSIPPAVLGTHADFEAYLTHLATNSAGGTVQLANELTNALGSSPAFLRSPDYPTSMIPSNLQPVLTGGMQRALDRFVHYRAAELVPDPDAQGSSQLRLDYDLLCPFADQDGGGLTHEVVPRELFAITPLEVRLKEGEKPWIEWRHYIDGELGSVLADLRAANIVDSEFRPRLDLRLSVRVSHGALPGTPEIWSEEEEHALVEASIPGFGREYLHFDGASLRPRSLEKTDHYLELSTNLAPVQCPDSLPSVHREGRLHIEGEARLDYWSEDRRGCAAALLEALLRGLDRSRNDREREPVEGDAVAEEPGSRPTSASDFRSGHERRSIHLGEFTVGDADDPVGESGGIVMDDATGLSPVGEDAPGRANVVTAGGPFVEVDFLVERLSVDPELFDWLQVTLTGFSLIIDEKEDVEDPAGLDVLQDRAPFEIEAKVNGETLSSAPFRLFGGPWNPATVVSSGEVNPVLGEQWARELYVRKDAENPTLALSLEARRGSELLATAELVIARDCTVWSSDGAEPRPDLDGGEPPCPDPSDPDVEAPAWNQHRPWGIPAGHGKIATEVSSADRNLTGHFVIEDHAFTPAAVPIEHRPKEIRLDFEEVTVHKDLDPFAAGELTYWASLLRESSGDTGFVEVAPRSESRRVLEVSAGTSAQPHSVDPQMDSIEGEFKPADTALVVSAGKELDNPGFPFFDPHDWLRKGSHERRITFDDESDGPMLVATDHYDLAMTLTTVSVPPKPRVAIWRRTENGSETVSQLVSEAGELDLTLVISSSWLDRLELWTSEWDDEAPGANLASGMQPDQRKQLRRPMPRGEYDPPLPGEYHTTDPNGEGEADFKYYLDHTVDVPDQGEVELRLFASNVAGAVVSDRVLIRSGAG